MRLMSVLRRLGSRLKKAGWTRSAMSGNSYFECENDTLHFRVEFLPQAPEHVILRVGTRTFPHWLGFSLQHQNRIDDFVEDVLAMFENTSTTNVMQALTAFRRTWRARVDAELGWTDADAGGTGVAPGRPPGIVLPERKNRAAAKDAIVFKRTLDRAGWKDPLETLRNAPGVSFWGGPAAVRDAYSRSMRLSVEAHTGQRRLRVHMIRRSDDACITIVIDYEEKLADLLALLVAHGTKLTGTNFRGLCDKLATRATSWVETPTGYYPLVPSPSPK